jgi:hypothetical protein
MPTASETKKRAERVLMTPRNKDIRSLQGILRSRRKNPASVKEMNEAIAAGFSKL